MDIIREKLAELRLNFLKTGSNPTDKDIAIIADMIYRRDKTYGVSDTEMLDVARGIEQGMKLMRQIMETDGRNANRRNKTCDALILGFFSLLKGKTHDELERGDIVEEYQTYFGITCQREGKI